MSRLAAPLLCLAVLSASPGPAAAEIEGDRFVSPEWGIEITAPRNWQMSEKTSYPNVLLWMVRRNPESKMLLSAERMTGPPTDALQYAKATAEILRQMGFAVHEPQLHATTGSYLLDFDTCRGRGRAACAGARYLRQAFLANDGIAYSLVLSAPNPRIRNQQLRAFDYALHSVHLRRRSRPEPDRDAAAGPP